MFGQQLEPDFDLGKEHRRNRLWLVLVVGLCLLGALFLFHPFSRIVFMAYSLTLLTYGDSFYVSRSGRLSERWLWKAILATLPLHLLVLFGIGWLTWVLPSFARTAISSVAFVAFCFACESVLFDRIADRFEPSRAAAQPS